MGPHTHHVHHHQHTVIQCKLGISLNTFFSGAHFSTVHINTKTLAAVTGIPFEFYQNLLELEGGVTNEYIIKVVDPFGILDNISSTRFL